MTTSMILEALTDLRTMCLSTKDIKTVMQKTNLLIFEENGYYIYSYEFIDYLKVNHSISISHKELDELLPDIVKKFGTHIEPMKTLTDFSQYCYKIFLT